MKTYSQRTADFYKIYSSKVLPILKNYEADRKRTLFFITLEIIVAAFLYLWAPVYLLLFDTRILMSAFYISICIGGVAIATFLVILINKQSKSFTNMLKKMCLPYVIKVFETLRWKDDVDKITDIDLRKSLLFAEYNQRSCDDAFSGEYKGVNFVISETQLLQEHRNGKFLYLVPIFKGVIINFKFNKTIKAKTIVTTKNDMFTANSLWLDILQVLLLIPFCFIWYYSNLLDKIVLAIVILLYIFIFVGKKITQEKVELVKLEDPAFGKRFNVYSGDQVEARYLVTPSFMERFYNVKMTFGSKGIKCSFFEDVLMVAISTKKDLFEFGSIFRSLSDPKSIQNFYDELSSIYTLIDTFKLDEITGI